MAGFSGFVVWVPLVALFVCVTSRAQKDGYRFTENKPIALTGTIQLVHDFGPPGYGESPKMDAHVSYWAVETALKVDVTPAQREFDCIPTRRMKLFFPGSELKPLMRLPAAKWKDQHVRIIGKIHCADTAGEMTTLYMDVDKIEALSTH